MNNSIHIGNIIREKFEESGMSIPEFADALHKTRTTVYDIFNRKSMDVFLLLQISDILDYNFLGKIYELHKQHKQSSSL